MSKLTIKKAKITSLFHAGIKAAVEDGKQGFIRRRDIDWKDPYCDLFSRFSIGQEIDVAVLGENPNRNNELVLSIKHVDCDPWNNFATRFRGLTNTDEPMIARGVIRDVLQKEVLILLEDDNDAILRKYDLEDLGKYKDMELSDIFAVGDHVRGIVKWVDDAGRTIELSISQYITHLYKRHLPPRTRATIGDIAGDKLELLGRLLEQFSDNQSGRLVSEAPVVQNAVFVLDNETRHLEELKAVIESMGVKCECFHFTRDNAAALEYHMCEITDKFSCAVIDKNLDDFSGTRYASFMLECNPTFPVIMITREHPYQARERLKEANLQNRVFLIVRPHSDEEIAEALNWAQKGLEERRYILEELRHINSTAGEISEPLPERVEIEEKLSSLCNTGIKKSVVLEVNPITLEIDLLNSWGLDNEDWGVNKTTLRHSPMFDIIKSRSPQRFNFIQEERKRHFPEEVKSAISMIGVPLRVFGDISYGLFIFGMAESLNQFDYNEAIARARELGPCLERYLFKQKMLVDQRFRTMGIMYASMRHDLIGLMDGLSSFDIVKEWDEMKERMKDSDSEGESARTDFRETLKDIKKIVDQIRHLLDHYAVIDKKDEVKEDVNIKKLIEEAITVIKASDSAERIDIEILDNSVGADTEVFIAKTRLQQIISNVLLNACQQINDSSLPVRKVIIKLSFDTTDKQRPIRILVGDTGPGVHRKDFERIFSPLHTTRKSGLGLGLHYCKELLNEIGGDLLVLESYMLSGTTFAVELPSMVS